MMCVNEAASGDDHVATFDDARLPDIREAPVGSLASRIAAAAPSEKKELPPKIMVSGFNIFFVGYNGVYELVPGEKTYYLQPHTLLGIRIGVCYFAWNAARDRWEFHSEISRSGDYRFFSQKNLVGTWYQGAFHVCTSTEQAWLFCNSVYGALTGFFKRCVLSFVLAFPFWNGKSDLFAAHLHPVSPGRADGCWGSDSVWRDHQQMFGTRHFLKKKVQTSTEEKTTFRGRRRVFFLFLEAKPGKNTHNVPYRSYSFFGRVLNKRQNPLPAADSCSSRLR